MENLVKMGEDEILWNINRPSDNIFWRFVDHASQYIYLSI